MFQADGTTSYFRSISDHSRWGLGIAMAQARERVPVAGQGTASPSRSAQGLIAQTLKKLSEEERFAFEFWPFLLRFHVLN